jgi:hypothetical protein
MKRYVGIIICLILLFFCGCATPELTQRYRSATWNRTQIPEDCIGVSAFTLDTPSIESQVAIRSLTPEGQAAFIKAVARKAQNMDDFMETLGGSLGKKSAKKGIIDLTVFKKRFVFTADRNLACSALSPADRISDLQVGLKIKDRNDVEFVSWDKFITQYSTIDLGKMSLAQQTSSEISMSVGSPTGSPVPITISPKTSYTRNLSEEVLLRQRYVVTSGRLNRNEAVLYLQGVVGIDLTGNFLVDITFQVKANSEPQLIMVYGPLRKDGKLVKPEEIRIDFVDLKYPANSNSITCNMEYLYMLRHVKKHDETIIESDDNVDFITFRNKPFDVEVINEKELKARVFGIVTRKLRGEEKTSKDGWFLCVEGLEKRPIYFPSYSSAREFLEWIKESKNTKVAGYEFFINQRPLNPADIPSLLVKGVDLN